MSAEQSRAAEPADRPMTRALVAIKAVHTVAWFSIESCVVYVLYAGFRGRSRSSSGGRRGGGGGRDPDLCTNGCPHRSHNSPSALGRGRLGYGYLPAPTVCAQPAGPPRGPLIALAVPASASSSASTPEPVSGTIVRFDPGSRSTNRTRPLSGGRATASQQGPSAYAKFNCCPFLTGVGHRSWRGPGKSGWLPRGALAVDEADCAGDRGSGAADDGAASLRFAGERCG